MIEHKTKYDRENFKTSPSDFEYVGINREKTEEIHKPSTTYLQDSWRRFKKNKLALFFLFILALYFLVGIFGNFLTDYTYFEQNPTRNFMGPIEGFKYGHYLGTDYAGRDIFARMVQGIRISLSLSFTVASICVVFGSIYGSIAAYFGGKIDTIMVRAIEIVLSIPSMIYIILLMVVMGNSITTIIIAMASTSWLGYALLVRGEVLKIKENEYVLASRTLGANFWWIIRKHLIPNTISIILVRLTMNIPAIIFSEAFLSFIGLGVPLPQASLGNLVSDGFGEMNTHFYLFLEPAIIISLLTLSFNIIGDALSDALNPKLRD